MISAGRNLFPPGAKGDKVKREEELLMMVRGRASVSLYKSKQIAAKLKHIPEAREFYNGIEQKHPLLMIIPIFPAQQIL